MRVEMTLDTGVTVTSYALTFKVNRDPFNGNLSGFTWVCSPEIDSPTVMFVRPEAVDAVIVYPESRDTAEGLSETFGVTVTKVQED